MASLPDAVTIAAHQIQVQLSAYREAGRDHPETTIAGGIAQEVSGVNTGHEDRAPWLLRQPFAVRLAIAANLVGHQRLQPPCFAPGGGLLKLGQLDHEGGADHHHQVLVLLLLGGAVPVLMAAERLQPGALPLPLFPFQGQAVIHL